MWFIDASPNLGVAEGAVGAAIPRLYTVPCSSAGEVEQVYGKGARWLCDRLNVSRPDVIWIEAPMPAGVRKHERAIVPLMLMGLYGALVGVAGLARVPVHGISVKTVRAAILGNGNLPGEAAKREAMRIAIAEGASPANYDEADAWCGWRYVQSLYPGGIPAPEHRMKRAVPHPAGNGP